MTSFLLIYIYIVLSRKAEGNEAYAECWYFATPNMHNPALKNERGVCGWGEGNTHTIIVGPWGWGKWIWRGGWEKQNPYNIWPTRLRETKPVYLRCKLAEGRIKIFHIVRLRETKTGMVFESWGWGKRSADDFGRQGWGKRNLHIFGANWLREGLKHFVSWVLLIIL